MARTRAAALWSFYALLAAVGAVPLLPFGTEAQLNALTQNPSNTFSTGTLLMSTTLGTPASATPFAFGTISNLLPGEAVTKFLNVNNTGSLAFTYTMTGTATSSSQLDSNATQGLQLEIKQCSSAWSGVDSCSGATVSTLYSGRIAPMTGTPVNLGTVPGSSVGYLQVRVSLPAASTGMTGLSSTLTFTWDATNT